MTKQFSIAVVGGTGAVGREMLHTLERRGFPVGQLRVMASARSAGTEVEFLGEKIVVEDLEKADFRGVDFVLSSPGGSVSRAHSPRMAEQGAIVIDNTSAWRMDPTVPLVVAEVNPDAAFGHKGIIANPNCSTIQMVVALKPIHDAAGIERVVVSTYQSASGAGQKGMWELWNGVKAKVSDEAEPAPSTFAYPLAFDVLPQIDVFDDAGYTKEELKMLHETRKIMGLPTLVVSATCVRVPVMRGDCGFEEPTERGTSQSVAGQCTRNQALGQPGKPRVPNGAHGRRHRRDMGRPCTRRFRAAKHTAHVGRVRQSAQGRRPERRANR